MKLLVNSKSLATGAFRNYLYLKIIIFLVIKDKKEIIKLLFIIFILAFLCFFIVSITIPSLYEFYTIPSKEWKINPENNAYIGYNSLIKGVWYGSHEGSGKPSIYFEDGLSWVNILEISGWDSQVLFFNKKEITRNLYYDHFLSVLAKNNIEAIWSSKEYTILEEVKLKPNGAEIRWNYYPIENIENITLRLSHWSESGFDNIYLPGYGWSNHMKVNISNFTSPFIAYVIENKNTIMLCKINFNKIPKNILVVPSSNGKITKFVIDWNLKKKEVLIENLTFQKFYEKNLQSLVIE